MATNAPHPAEVRQVETSLYNRMVRNASIGFIKSAAIGAVIGLVVGAALAVAVGGELIPALPFLSNSVFTAALQTALGFAGVAGGFGAVAGIQSTRDTRRFFLMHESAEAQPPELSLSPAVTLAPELAECGCHFQNKLAHEAPAPAGRAHP